MATVEQPVTRSDLRNELDRTLKHYATKADIANLKVWIITTVVSVGAVVIAVLRFWQ